MVSTRRARILVAGLGATALMTVVLPARAVPFTYEVCGHVPITGAASVPHHESRFGQFYFDYVNEELGGIDGHPVRFRTLDDRYFPAGARDAAEQCRRAGMHLLVGPYGADQMLSVAKWAEIVRLPYLHGQLPRAAVEGLSYSATFSAPEDLMLRGIARSLFTGREGQRFGIVHVDSGLARDSVDALDAALAELGLEPSVAVPAQKDESQFQNHWRAFTEAEVTDVVMHVPLWVAIRMLAQRPVSYDPRFGSVLPEIAREEGADNFPDVRFAALHHPGPVYDPENRRLPWYDEMQEFLRIFRAYSPEQDPAPNDVDWDAYLRAKQIHRLLDHLDEDLSPASFQHAFDTYVEDPAQAFPTCGVDLSGGDRFGGHAWHAFTLTNEDWRLVRFCTDRDGADLLPVDLDCGDGFVILSRGRCVAQDEHSGVGRMVARDAAGNVLARAHGGCRDAADFEFATPTGVHEVRVVARDCSGIRVAEQVLTVGT